MYKVQGAVGWVNSVLLWVVFWLAIGLLGRFFFGSGGGGVGVGCRSSGFIGYFKVGLLLDQGGKCWVHSDLYILTENHMLKSVAKIPFNF